MKVSWTLVALVASVLGSFCVVPTHGGIDLGLASGSGPEDGFRGGLGDFFEKFLMAMMDERRNKSETDTSKRQGLVQTVIQLLSMRDAGFENMVDYGLDTRSVDLSSLPAPSDVGRFVRELVVFLERVIQEFLADPGTLFQYGLVQNPFPTHKFPDAVQFQDGVGTPVNQNQYAWAADFSDQCGIGVMVHSAGTPGLLSSDPAYPTLTLRDASGDIIFQKTLPQLQVGIRSALIVGCDRSATSVDVLLATIGGPGDLLHIKINTLTKTVQVLTRVAIPGRAPSVRRMQRLDGEDQCNILVAPLFDIGIGIFQPPVLYVVDVCNGLNFRQINFDHSLKLHSVWDFECAGDYIDGDLTCWFNLIGFRSDQAKAIEVDLVPKLFYGGYDSTNNVFDISELTTSFTVDSSAYSLLPIGDGSKALVCTLSGFVYQILGRNSEDVGNLGNIAESLELGDAQECQVCDTATMSCSNVALPGLVDSTAYVWDTVRCGDYVFVGTLDLANIAGNLLFELLTGIVGEIDDTIEIGPIDVNTDILAAFLDGFSDFAEASNSEIVLGLFELAKAVLVSLFFEDIISPYDFGFDIWYIKYSELEGPSRTFRPLTVNGFRGLHYKGSGGYGGGWGGEMRPKKSSKSSKKKSGKSIKGKGSKGSKGSEGDSYEEDYYRPKWPFSFRDPIEDGVRNMVCHTGVDGSHPILVVGSTVYGSDQESSTYTVELGGVYQ